MRYSAKGQTNRRLTVYDEQHEVVGDFFYTSIFWRKAQITTRDNAVYDLTPAGFWLNKVEISREGVPFASLKFQLGSGLSMWFENGMRFTMRRISLWRYDYAVLDSDGNEAASVCARYTWQTLNYVYEINIPTYIPDTNMNTLLPLLIAYSAQHLRLRRGYVGV